MADVDAQILGFVDMGRPPDLAQDLGERLESIDVNPLTALPSGALALDGLVVLRA